MKEQEKQYLKRVMIKTFEESFFPDLDSPETEEIKKKEAAKLFDVPVDEVTHNQLKAYILFEEDALLIRSEIAFLEEK